MEIFKWSEGHIKALINVWQEHDEELRSNKRNKKIYSKMAESLSAVTHQQFTPSMVSVKINCLRKQYRRVKAGLKSGTSPPTWIYYDAVNRIEGQHATNDQSLLSETLVLEIVNESFTAADLEGDSISGSSLPSTSGGTINQGATSTFVSEEEEQLSSPLDIYTLPDVTTIGSQQPSDEEDQGDSIAENAPPSKKRRKILQRYMHLYTSSTVACGNALSQLAVSIGHMHLEQNSLTSFPVFGQLSGISSMNSSLTTTVASLSEDALPNPRSCSAKKRSSEWLEKCFPILSDRDFKKHFHVNKMTFNFLVEKLQNELKKQDTSLKKSIPVIHRVAIAMFHLASCSEYRVTADFFGVGEATVLVITKEFCNAVIKILMPLFIQFPTSQEEIEEKIVEFDREHGFPQCIGAIDGCHIHICPPKPQAVDYYNYKGWHSIVLLAVADAKYKFTYINVGAPGRNNDSYILRTSNLWALLESSHFEPFKKCINGVEIPVCLLGDSAFPLHKHLMKPFPDNLYLTPVKEDFNYKLSSARIVIENAFGRLKARFRIVCKKMEGRPKNLARIIKTCCTLHNVCETFNDAPISNLELPTEVSRRPCVIALVQKDKGDHAESQR